MYIVHCKLWSVVGLSTFTVIRQERLSEGRFRYAVKEMKEREEDIRLTVVYVEDAVGNQVGSDTIIIITTTITVIITMNFSSAIFRNLRSEA